MFNFHKKKGTGALLDIRVPSEQAKDYKLEELVASVSPVEWKEKTEWRKFPISDQNGSGSCVAQTGAKLLGISQYLKSGEFVPFSATDIYRRRANKTGAGMAGTDALDIIKSGVTLEALLPSQKLTDAQMTDVKVEKYKEQVGEVFKVSNYIIDPVQDIDAIASIIQTTGKGVMVWYYFANNGEWSEVPTIKGQLDVYGASTARHSVTAVDFTLHNGKKALIIDDSWGNAYGKAGQRIITEDFHKARNFFAAHLMNFQFEETPKPKFTFTKDLQLGMRDEEVGALQDRLKAEGLFPVNTQTTSYFGSVTKKAVITYQAKKGLPQTGFVGELTRGALNSVV
jgi:hypothetical protein